MSEIDLNSLPPLLPADVQRTLNSGLPTEAQMDWEQYQQSWFTTQVVSLDTKLTTVSSATDANTASITQEIIARTTADAAQAQDTEVLNAKVDSNEANAQIQYTAFADRDTAIASSVTDLTATVGENAATAHNELISYVGPSGTVSQQLNSLSTTVGGYSSSISTLQRSYDGLSVKYGVVGTINGTTGGFVFQGVQRNDGSVTYDMEIDSNVTINGNLVVSGSINTLQLASDAVTTKYDVPKQYNHAIYGYTGPTYTAYNVIQENGAPIQGKFTVTQDTPIEISINPAIAYTQAVFKLAVFKNGVFEAPMGVFSFSGSGIQYCGTASDTSGVQGSIIYKSVLTPGTWTLDVRVSQLGNVINQSQTTILAGTRITMLATKC